MLGSRCWARACLWLLLASVWIASPAGAQIGAGALAGHVVDQAGAAVPGATVTVTAVGTSLSRTVITSQTGGYVVPGLAPGSYRVRVELSGFRPLTREAIRIATGETVRVDLQLQLGALSEAITVTADAPLLRSDTSGLGHVVDNRRVVDLPLNGRSFITLASLVPGVALPPPPAAPLPRINGGRPRTNEYLFDGISVLQPEPGQVAFFPNVDAIQEFKIESNSPPAEFGRFNGGVVNLTTKSGSNAFQGTVFEFFRNEALNARNFFASTNPVKPQFRRQSVRWCRWRACSTGSDVLLHRLSGPAADDRTNGHLHGADAAPAPGRLHRGHRRACAGHLRSGYNGDDWAGRGDSQSIPGQHDSRPANRSGCAHAAGAISPADQRRHRKQLPARRERDGRSKSVQPSHRSQPVDERRPRVRAVDAISGGIHPGDATSRRQWRHYWNTRPTGHDVLVIRVQLPANILEQCAERASCRRYQTHGRPAGCATGRQRFGESGPSGHSVRTRDFRTRCPRSSSAGISSLGHRRALRPRSARA